MQTLAALLAFALIAVSLVGLLLPVERLLPTAQFLPEHVDEFRLYDSARQRFTHMVWVGLTAAVCLAVLYWPSNVDPASAAGRLANRATSLYERYALPISLALIAGLLFWAFAARPRYNRVEPMIASAVLLFALASWPAWSGRIFDWLSRHVVVVVVLIAYVAILNLPGLLLNVELNGLRFVRSNDYHYAAILSGIEQLRAGDFDTSLARFNYGVIWKYLGAGILDFAQATTFGSYVRLVQGYQLLFAAVFILSAYLWSRGNALFVLFAAACFLPWAATLHPSIFAPNQSGIRMLPLALLPALLVSQRWIGSGYLRALFVGLASGVLILWNSETGIAALAGLGFAVLLMEYTRGGGIARLIALGLGIVAAAAFAIAVLLYLLSGGTLHPIELVRPLSGVLATGYSGLPLRFDLLALVIALCATGVALYTCFVARLRGDQYGFVERGALAVSLLVWFAYYLNRPHHWKLWTFAMLAVFMLEPLLRREFWRDRSPDLKALLRQPALVAFAMFMIFLPLHANLTYLRLDIDTTRQPNISGIRLPQEIVKHVDAQSAFVKQLADRQVVYLSATQFLMAMVTQRVNRMPSFDPFSQISTPAQLRNYQSQIAAARPDCVLVESADSPTLALNKPRQALFDRLRAAVGENYRLAGERSGWQVWQSPSGKSCLGNNS